LTAGAVGLATALAAATAWGRLRTAFLTLPGAAFLLFAIISPRGMYLNLNLKAEKTLKLYT
jgi:hypothetical protein